MPSRKANTQRSHLRPIAPPSSSGSEAETSDIEDVTDAMQSGAQTLMDIDYSSSPAPPSPPPEKPPKKSKSKVSSDFIKTVTAFTSGEHGTQRAVRSMLASSSSSGQPSLSRLKQAQQETNCLLKRKSTTNTTSQTAQQAKGKGKAMTSKYMAGTNMMKPTKQVKPNTKFRVQSIIILHKGVTVVDQDEDEEEADLELKSEYELCNPDTRVTVEYTQVLQCYGLAIINSVAGIELDRSWSHEDVNSKLRDLFPDLWRFFDTQPPEINPNVWAAIDNPWMSQWLLCSKRRGRSGCIAVTAGVPYAEGHHLDFNVSTKRAGFKERQLILTTRHPISSKVLRTWGRTRLFGYDKELLKDANTAGPSGTSNNSGDAGRTTPNDESIIDVDQYASEVEKTKKSKRKRSPLFEKSESKSDSESDDASSYLDGHGGDNTPTPATRVTRHASKRARLEPPFTQSSSARPPRIPTPPISDADISDLLSPSFSSSFHIDENLRGKNVWSGGDREYHLTF